MKKIIYLFALALLVPWNVSAQTGDSSLTDFPKFKDKYFQQAVYDYIQYENRNNRNNNKYFLEYNPVISFAFKEDGSLKKAEIIQTSGSHTVDLKVLNLCKNFIRKKYMTPAYSEEGAVPCTVVVRFDFYYPRTRDYNYPYDKQSGYRTYTYMGYWNPAVSGKDPWRGDRSGHYHP